MGMFKDLKKLSDQGKEIGKQSGRPTSMLGMLKDTPNMINQATGAIDDAMAMQADMQAQNAAADHRHPRHGDDQEPHRHRHARELQPAGRARPRDRRGRARTRTRRSSRRPCRRCRSPWCSRATRSASASIRRTRPRSHSTGPPQA